jgi:Tfp pilus assembly protein PilO
MPLIKQNKFNITPEAVKLIGLSICAVFTLACFILFGFYYHSYIQSQEKFKRENSRLVALEEDVQNLKELLKSSKGEREKLEVLLFTDRDIATFLDQIGDFAKKSQVKIAEMRAQKMVEVRPPEEISGNPPSANRDFAQGKEEKGPTLTFMPINMNIEGKFEWIIDFLFSLEKYRQLLTLSNVDIMRSKYPLINCKFILRLYSLKQIEEITKK